jgi:hypothetical protein
VMRSRHETAASAAPASPPFGKLTKFIRDTVRHELTAALAGIDLQGLHREPRAEEPKAPSPPADT